MPMRLCKRCSFRKAFASPPASFARTCPTRGCACRKPALGLVRDFVNAAPLDRERSAAVGDSDSDLEFARNLGIQGFKLGGPGAETWEAVAHALVERPRTATVHRRTKETDIRVTVDLDSEAEPRAKTGLGFFDHMLEQLGKHGGFKLDVQCAGDLHIDEHHTVEDVALTIGQALRQALGDKRGIQRYGFLLPMDEADAEVAIDLGGRPYLVFEAKFGRDLVGDLPTELVPHFFRSLAETLGAAIHVRVRGENTHHMIEVAFKGVARALRQGAQAARRRAADDEGPAMKPKRRHHSIVRLELGVAAVRARAARCRRAADGRPGAHSRREPRHFPGVGAAALGMGAPRGRGARRFDPDANAARARHLPRHAAPVREIRGSQTRLPRRHRRRDRRFPPGPDLPVPQMGWNELAPACHSPLLADVPPGTYAYFVHSYAAPHGPYTRAATTYGVPFSAVVEQGNFFGTQFHPGAVIARRRARSLENFLKIDAIGS